MSRDITRAASTSTRPDHGSPILSVPAHQAGIASGVFNTSRQIGGTLTIAVFGTLLSGQRGLVHGLRPCLLVEGLGA